MTTAVGANVLPLIASLIADGLRRRMRETDRPLNVVACENMIGAGSFLREQVYRHVTEAEKERHTRLTAGTLMTRAEVKDLTDVIPNLAFIMALARTFVKEKEKALGKRGNPFV